MKECRTQFSGFSDHEYSHIPAKKKSEEIQINDALKGKEHRFIEIMQEALAEADNSTERALFDAMNNYDECDLGKLVYSLITNELIEG